MPDSTAAEVGDPSTRAHREVQVAQGLHFECVDGSNVGASGEEWGSGKDVARDPRISSISSGAKYKSMSPARLPITRSPCLGIAPGLSPTTLLESPVLLTNIKAEPSPTTGTYSVPSVVNCVFRSDALSSPKESSNSSARVDGNSGDFEFKPHISSCSMSGPTRGTLAYTQGQPQNTCLAPHDLALSVSASSPVVETINSKDHGCIEVASDGIQQEKCSSSRNQSLQIDDSGSDPIIGTDRTSDDGYNWRKYGQKHVKGSEFPRSYYKCTHPNCQVKKQLERSHDGQITEIVYKGTHDHPKPQPSRRLAAGGVLSCQEEERAGRIFSFNSVEEGQTSHPNDQYGALGPSPASISDDETEGTVVRCNNNGEDVVDYDDPEAKKRRKETAIIDVSQMGKATREPRVVVQTLSEVDILDDGYRWRKYGQKVVKGNPNPRSYYKCTNMGCSVRKHVERASHDPKAVITTYEGKHNHDVPASRTSSHDTAALMAMNECSVQHSQIPTAFSGLQRIYDTCAIPHQFNHAEEKDTISLDLGVGLSPRPNDKADEQRETHKAEQIQSTLMIQTATSGYNQLLAQPTSVSPRYGSSNHGMDCFRPKEEKDGFSFNAAPLNCSSNPYQANLGSLLTGP